MKGRIKRGSLVVKKTLLTREEVLHVAKLAQLELTEEEVSKFQKQLSEVLDYVGQLQSVDTDGVPETSQVTGLENVSREDKVDLDHCLSAQEALANAPQTKNGYIKVKAVMKAK